MRPLFTLCSVLDWIELNSIKRGQINNVLVFIVEFLCRTLHKHPKCTESQHAISSAIVRNTFKYADQTQLPHISVYYFHKTNKHTSKYLHFYHRQSTYCPFPTTHFIMTTLTKSPIAPNTSRRLSEKTVDTINIPTKLSSPSSIHRQTFVYSPSAPSFIIDNSPVLPQRTRQPSESTLCPSILEGAYPSPHHQRTFLYSPSEASFRVDSPILPARTQQPSSSSTLCDSVQGGAYPSPHHQRTFLHSPSEASFSSSFSRWSSSTAIGGPSPPLTTHRISDWLPDDTGFYYADDGASDGNDRNYTATWNVLPPPDERVVNQAETETEPVMVGVVRDLPVIREGDFLYYPEPAAVLDRDDELKIRRRRLENIKRDALSFRGFLREMVRKVKSRTFR